RDDTAGIDRFEMPALALIARALEIPPRHAVLRADDDGVGAEERAQLRGEGGEAVRFDAEDHDVGRADRCEIAGDRWLDGEVVGARDDAESASAHCLQMRTARE